MSRLYKSTTSVYIVVGFPGMIILGVAPTIAVCETIAKSFADKKQYLTIQYIDVSLKSLNRIDTLMRQLCYVIRCSVCGSRVQCDKHIIKARAVERITDCDNIDTDHNCNNTDYDDITAEYMAALADGTYINSPPDSITREDDDD